MASRTVTRKHFDDTTTSHVRPTQGRKKGNPSLVKRGRTVHMTDADFQEAEKKAAELGWSFSKYADVAISLFKISELSDADNC